MGAVGSGRKAVGGMESEKPGFWVELAYATRRAESIHAAHAILTRAAHLHPTDATIPFNLACYEAQMGSFAQAKVNLDRATRIDPRFRDWSHWRIRIWSRCRTRSRRTKENILK